MLLKIICALLSIAIFPYISYHLGSMKEKHDAIFEKKRRKSILDKELIQANEGFTDCEIFD